MRTSHPAPLQHIALLAPASLSPENQIVYAIEVKIIWDEPKRQANIATHGLDLADAESFEWETAIVIRGHRSATGKPRFRVDRLRNDLVALVFSLLGTEAVSVISLRRASRAERKLYDQT
jgi:hypothetical protein